MFVVFNTFFNSYQCFLLCCCTCTSPIMHLICPRPAPHPPKFCITLCSSFRLGITAVPREIENKACLYKIMGGKGALWEMCKWRIFSLLYLPFSFPFFPFWYQSHYLYPKPLIFLSFFPETSFYPSYLMALITSVTRL